MTIFRFNDVRSLFVIANGIYPMAIKLGNARVDFSSGVINNIRFSDSREEGWLNGKLFRFKTPRSKIGVMCKSKKLFSSTNKFIKQYSYKGELRPGNKDCNGAPSRVYYSYSFAFLGNHNQKEAAQICEQLQQFGNYSSKSTLIGEKFYKYSAKELKNIYEAPFFELLKIINNENLSDGFYAFADPKNPVLIKFNEKGLEFQRFDTHKDFSSWKIPAICSGHLATAYCD